MFDNGVVVAVLAAITFLFLWMKKNGTKDDGKRYPPSPSSLSLLGAILRRGMIVMPEHFMKAADKHGPVLSYNFGREQVVILNGREAITEAFLKQSEAFADRTLFWTETNILNEKNRGIIFARYNETFKKYHKLSLAIFKEFGFGVNSVSETRILHQVESLNENILKFNGRSFDPKPFTAVSTFSVVASILFREEFVKSDLCHSIARAAGQFSRNVSVSIDFSPMLRFLPNFRRKINDLEQSQKDMFVGIEAGIKSSKSAEGEPTFVSRFIEIQGPNYDRQDFLYILRDICLGSGDTVSTTLLWTLAEMANHPKVQTRFQQELDEVVAKHRFPSLDDKPHLPYAEAVILEVMRLHTFVPLYVPHAALRDAEVLGCYIPKGSTVMANAYGVHMDPKHWKDPENFRPERFLDEENRITGSEYVISFSIGKRSCLGEVLARQEVFLFVTSVVQRFVIRPPEGQSSVSVKEVMGVGVFPAEFEVRMFPRFEDGKIKA